MTENEKRFRIEFTVDAEGCSDEFIKHSAIQELTCMVPYPEDITFSEASSWHTGTPTNLDYKYLCKIKGSKDTYAVMAWNGVWWRVCATTTLISEEYVVKWQKIEDEK